jgi:3-dehydroquinate synthase
MKIRVDLGDRSYPVVVGDDAAALPAAVTDALGAPRPGALISDAGALAHHGDRVRSVLEGAGFTPLYGVSLAPGEPTKQLATVAQVCEQLARAGLERQSPVFVLGGGVVGDLGGFAAAVFLRGVPLIQLPTTLLAQVDSAIGGKTGVNLPAGKNLVGAFWQPRLVYADVSTLATLPPREIAAGLAEVVKYGVIADEQILALLEQQPVSPTLLRELVERSAAIKAGVVSRDEREGGERALLNFGHTIGHAIEAHTGYGQLLHGEAVALGMLAACRVSVAYGGDRALEPRLLGLLGKLGLPTDLGRYLRPDVLAGVLTDKKRVGGKVRFVVADRAGRARIELVEPARIAEILGVSRDLQGSKGY